LGRRLFREVSDEYLRHYLLRKLDRETMAFQVRVLDRFFGEMPFEAIGEAEIDRFFAARQAEGISTSTCNRHLSALNGLFKWAVRRGFIQTNPIAALPRFTERPAEPRCLTPEEMARLILAAAPHLKAYLLTLAYAGSRMTETLRLRWSRVDLHANAITFVRETTKGQRTRTVPIAPPLREALCQLRHGKADDFVFVYNDRPVASMRTALRSAARRAGVGHLGFHTLRHSFGRFFIERGGPVVQLQRILGHSTINMTMRYVHITSKYVEKAIDYMGPPPRRKEEDEKEGG
jgi:integrase